MNKTTLELLKIQSSSCMREGCGMNLPIHDRLCAICYEAMEKAYTGDTTGTYEDPYAPNPVWSDEAKKAFYDHLHDLD